MSEITQNGQILLHPDGRRAHVDFIKGISDMPVLLEGSDHPVGGGPSKVDLAAVADRGAKSLVRCARRRGRVVLAHYIQRSEWRGATG